MSEAGPGRRGTNQPAPGGPIRPSTLRWWVGERRLGAVAAVGVVGLDPLLGDDGRAERELAAEHRRRDDLGELADLAVAVAAEHLQALALGGQAGAAAVGRDDERRDRDR